MEKDLISVIVPVYKVEKYLEKCINSLLEQTLEDIQIILVNDGSKDSSGEIAKNIKQTILIKQSMLKRKMADCLMQEIMD